jgi:cytidyltransferase-like protein
VKLTPVIGRRPSSSGRLLSKNRSAKQRGHARASSRPPKRGKRAENKEKTRRAILQAALDLFALKGFYQTTTKAISRKARIAEGTLFNYFETKEDLALYFFEQELAGIVDCEAVIVTRSEEGMSLYAKGEEPVHVPAYAVKVRDVSGPGDTVVATFAVMLSLGAGYETAMRAANAGAAVVVGKPGTATVSVDELRHRLLPAAATALEDKIVFDRSVLDARLAEWRRQRLRIGFTNGCFDLLHPGHLHMLEQARAGCDRLVVGLNSDTSLRRVKGADRPVQPEPARAAVLASLASVDLVCVFDEDTPERLIRARTGMSLDPGTSKRTSTPSIAAARNACTYGATPTK